MDMHVLYDKQKGLLTLDAQRHVYGCINHMVLKTEISDPKKILST